MFEIYKIHGKIAFKELGSWGTYESAKDRIKEFGAINTSIESIEGIDELVYCAWGSSANRPGHYIIINSEHPDHIIQHHENLGDFIEW